MKNKTLIIIGATCLMSFTLLQNDEWNKSIARGKEIYTDFCVTCHKPNGEGFPKIFPPLASSDYLNKSRNDVIHSVKYGLSGKITVNSVEYNGIMQPLGLEDGEVADVLNYICNSWGNQNKKMFTTTEVDLVKK